MSDDKVRVRAKGAALCPDFDAADREPPLRRFIGRKYVQTTPGQFAYAPTGEPEAVSKRAEIAQALAEGDLFAADAETAAWATAFGRGRVAFDPTFGGALGAPAADSTSDKPAKGSKAGTQ
jgi:hypothetical protein